MAPVWRCIRAGVRANSWRVRAIHDGCEPLPACRLERPDHTLTRDQIDMDTRSDRDGELTPLIRQWRTAVLPRIRVRLEVRHIDREDPHNQRS